MAHWILGSAICWPLGVMIGRRAKHYQGGVPVVPTYVRFHYDFINVEPSRAGRLAFRWWAVGSALIGGYIFARMTTDNQQVS